MHRFRFGPSDAPGFIAVTPQTAYAPERGFGWKSVFRNAPSIFAIDLPEGNYTVTLTLGDEKAAGATTVRAEARRLMLRGVRTQPGEVVTQAFTVNVRTPAIPQVLGGGAVRLKEREIGSPTWDNALTLEFLGDRPAVRTVEIASAPEAPTIFLAGDSTVTDQTGEPYAAWGQMLPRFFGPGVAIANHAESGESLASFRSARRMDKVLASIKKGDFLFVQFGHNDQKLKGAGEGAFGSYTSHLKYFLAQARERGATPVLVTPVARRRFDEAGKMTETLGDFPAAVKRVAEEEKVALIVLNAQSRTLFEALGPEVSKQAFVHVAANTFPGQDGAIKDDTHFSDYGAYQLARVIVEGIRAANVGLDKYLRADAGTFDAARPEPAAAWKLSPTQPDGA